MTESARHARPDDAAAVSQILNLHAQNIAEDRGAKMLANREMAFLGQPEETFQTALASENNLLIVGTFDEIVFGIAMLQLETLPNKQKLGRLMTFVVDAEIRKTGVGQAMMDLVITEAKAKSCIGIDSLALPGDRHTKNFFESNGMKARLLTVHRSLQD